MMAKSASAKIARRYNVQTSKNKDRLPSFSRAIRADTCSNMHARTDRISRREGIDEVSNRN
jgi:hypothetical protein